MELGNHKTLLIFFVVLQFFQCLPGDGWGEAGGQAMNTWNTDGEFSLPVFDSGVIKEGTDSLAPWGSSSWGFAYATFKGSFDHVLTATRFKSSGWDVYLYGKDTHPGRAWGYARFVQGDIWGSGSGGPRQYYIPSPGSLHNRRVLLNLDCIMDTAKLLTPNDSWIMAAVNIWLSGPGMPPGKDRLGRKPLVIDLYIYHKSNMGNIIPQEDDLAFHVPIALKTAILGEKMSWSLDITPQLVQAVQTNFPGLNQPGTARPQLADLKIYQLDFVLEMVNAEAAATIDNFNLEIQPDGPSN